MNMGGGIRPMNLGAGFRYMVWTSGRSGRSGSSTAGHHRTWWVWDDWTWEVLFLLFNVH